MGMQKVKDEGFTFKKFLVCIAVWVAVCLTLHLIVQTMEGRKQKKLVTTGIAISKDISSQSGLALLEKKYDHLSRLINDITQRPGVVFASIIDHKNKLIAYSDQKQFFSLNRENASRESGIEYWRAFGRETHNVINFLTPITFSNTRIGEVFLSFAVESYDGFHRFFVLFSVLSLLGLCVVFGLANYRQVMARLQKKDSLPIEKPADLPYDCTKDDAAWFTCPLCSAKTPFSSETCKGTPPESMVILDRYAGPKNHIMLCDLDGFEDLNWIKKQIITRCTQIISAITAQ